MTMTTSRVQQAPLDLTPKLLAQLLQPGRSVYWPGCAGQSPLFEQWLLQSPAMADGIEFCGVWIPGVNRFDPTALHPRASAKTFFLSRDLRDGWSRGSVDYLPLHYSEIVRQMAEPGRFDVLMLQVAPPDADGNCSLALAADFTPAALAGCTDKTFVLAHVNPLLPRTNGPAVPVSRIHAWIEASLPQPALAPEPEDDALEVVARNVASLVRDGDTLQFGLGRLQARVLAALSQHRDLRLHAGMVSDGLVQLHASGALAAPSAERPPVCTGVALGGPALQALVADGTLVRFAGVEYTHSQATLAAIPNLVAVNSALEIDLFGQVNCETLGGRQISGVGGLVDFIRGARASAGGRAVIAATSVAGRGRRSRIVPELNHRLTGIARTDIDHVVTEYGIASLRGLGVDARARALIAIAAPESRPALEARWHTLRQTI
jgi:acyl-CoA hydrolase